MKKIYLYISILITLIGYGCDRDRFADLNTKPSEVSEAEIRFSMSKAIEQMYENDYTLWFYNNFQYIQPWTQVGTWNNNGVIGNVSAFNEMGPSGSYNLYEKLFTQTEDIRVLVSKKPAQEKESYQAIVAMTYPVQILPAMANSDLTGSLVYSEAVKLVDNYPLLTPKYDNLEKLYNTWLDELTDAANTLNTAQNQFEMGQQDYIYNGDFKKWAKLCNLLKLKIAARLVHIDRSKALRIAEEVGKSQAGYPDALEDDFIYHRGIKYHGTGNDFRIGYAGKSLVDFLVKNQDPRLRFIFEKNDFNAEVVQAFIDSKTKLPAYVEAYVNLDAQGNFESWKAPGEPWVRYHGAPLSPEAKFDSKYESYFNQGVLHKITVNGIQKNYTATSSFSEKQVRTTFKYVYPTKPGGRVIELKDNEPPLNMILASAGEANLFLAEFKLLGANLPQTAQAYLNRGVELSARRMDLLAKSNQMPYYEKDPVYINSNEAEQASTKLHEKEIEALLANPALDLTTDGLEKVYIQQYINYIITPNDLWTTVRRSGIPKKNSSYLAWEKFISSGSELPLPRRFVVSTVTKDDPNYTNKENMIKEQGFTTGTNNPVTLQNERLWFDKSNPEYGAGPIH